jgi:hypothetical protein
MLAVRVPSLVAKGSSSFLKKRSKKLLLMARGIRSVTANTILPITDKSFLVLFFKKELLAFGLFQ